MAKPSVTSSNSSNNSSGNSTAESAPNFEAAVAELEAIVAQMETGQLPLEQSLAAYKRGAELLQLCQQSLTNAEQQVRILNDANQLSAFKTSDLKTDEFDE
jgi:exodeoxyribonuclease VII small subunit